MMDILKSNPSAPIDRLSKVAPSLRHFCGSFLLTLRLFISRPRATSVHALKAQVVGDLRELNND